MISRELFEDWLVRALRFANLPAGCAEAEADAAIRGEVPEAPLIHMPWHPPVRGYRQLHADWRVWLTSAIDSGSLPRLQRREKLRLRVQRRLRKQCEHWAMGEFGQHDFITASRDLPPFGFDASGRPQLGVAHAASPGALLAVVGAELIAPDSPARICQCGVCGKYWAVSLVKRPPHRVRTKYCKDCKEPVSTPRVKKWRLAKAAAAKPKRRKLRE